MNWVLPCFHVYQASPHLLKYRYQYLTFTKEETDSERLGNLPKATQLKAAASLVPKFSDSKSSALPTAPPLSSPRLILVLFLSYVRLKAGRQTICLGVTSVAQRAAEVESGFAVWATWVWFPALNKNTGASVSPSVTASSCRVAIRLL